MRAYKYVDLEHAGAAEGGSLKIGTLGSYGVIEGARRDGNEGAVIRHVDELTIGAAKDDPEGVELAKRHGFVGGGNITFMNLTLQIAPPPIYCFCMSRDEQSAHLASERPQAVFEILGVHALAVAVKSEFPKRVTAHRIGRVKYGSITVRNREEPLRQSDPFLKDVSFEPENEVRIVWEPASKLEVEPFFTGPNVKIARLLRRIA